MCIFTDVERNDLAAAAVDREAVLPPLSWALGSGLVSTYSWATGFRVQLYCALMTACSTRLEDTARDASEV